MHKINAWNRRKAEEYREHKLGSHKGIPGTDDQRDTIKVKKMRKAMVAKWQLLSKRKYGVLEPEVK